MTARYRKLTIQLNVDSDADILDYLDSVANATEAIRHAIRLIIQQEE